VDPVLGRGWLLVAVLRLATALARVEGWPLAQLQALSLPQVSPLALVESALAVLLFG